MKFLASLLLIGATSAPVLAGPATGYKSSGGFAREEKCFKTEYRGRSMFLAQQRTQSM